MRRYTLVLAIVLCASFLSRPAASAFDAVPFHGTSVAAQAQEVDDNDDTRVEVQLVVLAIAVGTVFVLGTGVYLLRRRLGLVAPPPEPGSDGHH